jgi:prepilin-type N-terminal cleavage/methylation domain-containing protein
MKLNMEAVMLSAKVKSGVFKGSMPSFKAGFTIIEILVVIIIIGVLMAIAVPTYLSIVPRGELRTDARSVMNLMQRARMSASNFQRPIRVLIDCTNATRGTSFGSYDKPCRIAAQVAVFNSAGAIKSWSPLTISDAELHKSTNITYLSNVSKKKPQFDHYKSLFGDFYTVDGSGPRTYGVYSEDGFNSDSIVVVFTPGGEAVSYCPVDLKFTNKHLTDSSAWKLSVVNSTGHVRLTSL